MEKDGGDIDSDTGLTTFINKLYTYKYMIKHGNIMLKSDVSNFKEIAIKDNFLKKTSTSNLATEETQFASSELLFLNVMQYA